MTRLHLILCGFLFLAACQPDPAFTEDGPRLLGERTLEPTFVLPTLIPSETVTPVVVPVSTSQPEIVVEVPGITPDDTFNFVTPTLPPSKTPTMTPTQTLIPSATSSPTVTVTATAFQFQIQEESQQFVLPDNLDTDTNQVQSPTTNNNSAFGPQPQPVQNEPGAVCTQIDWFFDQYEPPVCPTGTAISGAGAFQQFETGYMIWLEATDVIYVLYNSNEQPRWEIYEDIWNEGMPEIDENFSEAPPIQSHQPRRGFGEIWRQFPSVRQRTGWAIQQFERPYAPRFQEAEDGSIVIEDPFNGIFYMSRRGTDWKLYRRSSF